MKMRSTTNSSTHYAPYELLGMQQPKGEGTTIIESTDTDNNMAATEEQLLQWNATKEAKTIQAIANDLEARDARLIAMNSKRKPKSYNIGDWACIANPLANKTNKQISEPMKIIGRSTNLQIYTLQDSNGKTRRANIAMLRDTTTTNYSKGPETKTIGPKAALVKTFSKGKTTFYVIDQEASAKDKAHWCYDNKRKKSEWTQQRWELSKTTITDYTLLEEFNMEISSRNFLIPPTEIRRNHPSVAILQQGKKKPTTSKTKKKKK